MLLYNPTDYQESRLVKVNIPMMLSYGLKDANGTNVPMDVRCEGPVLMNQNINSCIGYAQLPLSGYNFTLYSLTPQGGSNPMT